MTPADAAAFILGLAAGIGLAAVVLVVGADLVSRVFTRAVWG
jgi:tagatose-1,6-bisphosphate aldolase non-catalytic subunit AgaZ/GatZ